MKKLLCALMAIMMILALCACGDSVPANKVFGLDDLPGKLIGVQDNTTGDIFASDYQNPEDGSDPATVERYSKGNDAVMALKQGKLDCVIIDEQTAKAFIANNSDLKILEEDFGLEEYAICVKKENTELYNKLNDTLNELLADGTFDAIVNNYIGDDAGGNPYKTPDSTTYENGTLTMATNAYFPPYEYYDGGDIVGIDADVARAICDKLGYKLVIEDMDFNSIVGAVQTGKADFGMAGMTVTEARLKSVDFTDSYASSKQVIIVRAK